MLRRIILSMGSFALGRAMPLRRAMTAAVPLRTLALALSAALLCSTVQAHDYTVTWGVEQYNSCTSQNYGILLSTPTGNTFLKRINGVATGIGSGASDTNYVRSALVTFFSPTLMWATLPYATVTAPPQVPNNQSVANGIGVVVLKQTGTQVVSTPVDIKLDTPLALPKNKLFISIQAQSYPTPAPTTECIDIEVQVMVTFSDQ
jgi:hypothetical protein